MCFVTYRKLWNIGVYLNYYLVFKSIHIPEILGYNDVLSALCSLTFFYFFILLKK